jgi:hypothetical protein
VKVAAVTVPVLAGKVTPPAPPVVRVPAGARMVVPATVAETATLPKFISTVLTIVIGVMMLAVTEAVAEACANVLLAKPNTAAVIASDFTMFFILFSFSLFELIDLFDSTNTNGVPEI